MHRPRSRPPLLSFMTTQTNSNSGIRSVAKSIFKCAVLVILCLMATAALVVQAYNMGYEASMVSFQQEAKVQGFAWHDRTDGRWTWKTQDEVFTTTIDPLVQAVELDLVGQNNSSK